MIPPLSGLHHVTAIPSDPQRNVDFYTGLLGLRLVKVTVDVDDPEAYHLYYGDEVGRPDTLLTFYCWPEAAAEPRVPPHIVRGREPHQRSAGATYPYVGF
jgi:glyoxalase family protein